MKYQIPFRVVVTDPLPGVSMRVQQGKDDLLPPTDVSASDVSFEFDITVDVTDGPLNFLGGYAQGPKDTRFVYVNSGTYAGQTETCWARRAKLPLMSITRKQIEMVLKTAGSCVEARMRGVGKDGGPTCASVKGLEWNVVVR
jgi:hypothetical protein